jgi:hypothetical protein
MLRPSRYPIRGQFVGDGIVRYQYRDSGGSGARALRTGFRGRSGQAVRRPPKWRKAATRANNNRSHAAVTLTAELAGMPVPFPTASVCAVGHAGVRFIAEPHVSAASAVM